MFGLLFFPYKSCIVKSHLRSLLGSGYKREKGHAKHDQSLSDLALTGVIFYNNDFYFRLNVIILLNPP